MARASASFSHGAAMSPETGVSCGLQVARARRLSVYPDEFGMEQEICDVTLWLIEKHSLSRVRIWIDRHYTQIGRKFADLTVVASPSYPARLTEAAHEAFLALGYRIEDTGTDTYAHPSCFGHHSKHDALRAYGRIEAAVKASRATN